MSPSEPTAVAQATTADVDFNRRSQDLGVRVVKHPKRAGERTLIATRDFQPGDVVFREDTAIHTRHPLAQEYSQLGQDVPSVPVLALDWQRLIYVWTNMLHSSEEEAELMLAHLSTDGVTSPLARETDPERESDYREGLRAFRERVKTLAKKARATKLKRGAIPRLRYPDLAVPPLNTLERMIAIIETNCHARDFSDAVMERYLHEDAQEEQWVGVWLCASMMDHSCANNATCDFEELVEELEDRHPTPFTMDTATLVVTAVRAIRAGDHVTINYNEVDGASREEQREALRRRGFECQCSKCANC